ncbi:hypothetical protein LCGC14_1838340 [marine sediment metagenome]|uniref:Uncharacterized protein n=1 Tax=marine sediment metagenome TaxID=412755 RepID=A0A0F9GE11_9ZZZZ
MSEQQSKTYECQTCGVLMKTSGEYTKCYFGCIGDIMEVENNE